MTTITRRQLLKPLAALGPAIVLGAPAWAQTDWAAQPVKLVVPFPPGGSSDMLGRLIADRIGKLTGANFFVENKPGGTTQIATELVSAAPADGRTVLLAAASTFTMLPNLRKLSFSIDSFEFAGGIAAYIAVMAVRNDLPIRSVKDFVAYAKAHPGKLSYGSAGEASAGHIYGATLARDTGIQLLHVPFRGSAAAVTALLGNEIDFIIDGAVTPMAKAGRVRSLAVMHTERHPELPKVPTMKEAGYAVTTTTSAGWGLATPKGTPAAIMKRLSDALHEALQQADVKDALARANSVPAWQTPAEFRQRLAQDQKLYAELLPAIGVRAN